MYKFLLIVPVLLVSCSTVTLQGTAPCNGKLVITKPTRQFDRHTQSGTVYRIVPKPICTIPFKKGDRIDENLTFCFLSGSELSIEVRHVHDSIVNKHYFLCDDLIGETDFVPDCTEKIVIGDKHFTVHPSSAAGNDSSRSYQYVSHDDILKR